jgi:hypothetical protein
MVRRERRLFVPEVAPGIPYGYNLRKHGAICAIEKKG